jgi:hypothetical protein
MSNFLTNLNNLLHPNRILKERSENYGDSLQRLFDAGREYDKALDKYKNQCELVILINKEMIIKGPNSWLTTAQDHANAQAEIEKEALEKCKVDYETLKISSTQAGVLYDQAINTLGLLYTLLTLGMVYTVWSLTDTTLKLIQMFNEPAYIFWIELGNKVNSNFYEVTIQITIALAIAIFFNNRKSNRRENHNTKWWNFLPFSAGVTSAFTGTFLCLSAIAFDLKNIYTFTLVVACLIILLISAVRPLLSPKSI